VALQRPGAPRDAFLRRWLELGVGGYRHHVIVMTEIHLCPGCGKPVEPSEDYVGALDYDELASRPTD
jgi:hypothetical protein